ncbi:MAG TPA: hypothetical protein VM736_09540 [Gemmatimonadales bacterium]|nr:hypothetical protein [Gemmatimonadales bacterium]
MRTLLACAGLVVAASCSRAEQQLESGRQYISITYTDTTFESFGRTDRAIIGVVIADFGDSVRFRIHTNPDALVSVVDVTLHPATRRDERPVTRRLGMPKGTMPVMGSSVAFLEQLLRRSRVVGGDSVSIPVMMVGAQASLTVFTVIRNGSDSVLFVAPDGNSTAALHLAVDSAGHITGGVIPVSGTKIIANAP